MTGIKMLKNFMMSNGKKIWINFQKGEVIRGNAWSETQISSRVNPGFVTKGGFMVGGGTSISSTTVQKREIWMRLEDGTDKCFTLTNRPIAVLEGHKLMVVTGGVEGKGAYLAVHQFNDGQTLSYMTGGHQKGVLFAAGLASPIWVGLRTGVYIACVLSVIGIPLIPVIMFITYRHHQAMAKELSDKVFSMLPEAIAE